MSAITTPSTTDHRFIVSISDCSPAEAEQVIAERINPDEDYGFAYSIGYKPDTQADERAQLRERLQDLLTNVNRTGSIIPLLDGVKSLIDELQEGATP